MIDRDHDLPIKRQAEVLHLSRSTLYYCPCPVSAEDLGCYSAWNNAPLWGVIGVQK